MRKASLAGWVLFFSLPAMLSGCAPDADRSQADRGVAEFHERFNRSAFGEIYDTADQSLRTTIPKDDFVSGLQAIRNGHGAAKTARQIAIDYNYSSDGRMVKILISTSFEKGDAEEQFIFMIDDHGPHLRSYVFK